MTMARLDQHRCHLRVRSSRHDRSLPIGCAGRLHQPAIGRLTTPFWASTWDAPLFGVSRQRATTGEGAFANPART